MNEPFSLDIDIKELPWPDGTHKFFEKAHSSLDSAFIFPTRSWHIYADGYKTAYERLFESWKSGLVRPDNLAYPLVFLCRHYIELRLKDIMETSQRLLSLPVEWKKSHKLDFLWTHVRPLVEKIWPNEPPATLNIVESMIKEFDIRDPQGMAFRYPIGNDGKEHLLDISGIRLSSMEHAMSQLGMFLDSVAQGTSVYLDDMRSSTYQ